MKKRWAISRSVLGIVVIIGCSLVCAAAALSVRVPPPGTLATARPATTAAVTERAFEDRRDVQLTVVTGAPAIVSAPRPGKLTALDCTPHTALLSGTAPIAIDGRRLILLATAVPLWRSLAPGDRGDDVAALQRELTRLGHASAEDGVIGSSTLAAIAGLRAALGLPPEARRGVDPADFAWSPHAEARVESCVAAVGKPVIEGTELITFPVAVVSARLASVPADRAPGPRLITSGDAEIATDDDGAVDGADALLKVSELPEFRAKAATAGEVTIPVGWSLRSPLAVLVVPPTALWDIHRGSACILPARGRPKTVTIVGSDLGQSFVTTDVGPLTEVRVRPPTGTSCR